jgi:uncharacterized protein
VICFTKNNHSQCFVITSCDMRKKDNVSPSIPSDGESAQDYLFLAWSLRLDARASLRAVIQADRNLHSRRWTIMAKLRDADSGEVVIQSLEIANTFFKRFVGLQFRKSLGSDSAILLTPCSSIHTCFMRFPIDIIMIDVDGLILGTKRNVRPWRAVLCLAKTRTIIETKVNAIDLPVGTKLTWSDLVAAKQSPILFFEIPVHNPDDGNGHKYRQPNKR